MAEDKSVHYATIIGTLLAELFNPDSEHYIDLKEFDDDNNATDFIHAMANMVPCKMYGFLTGDMVNNLEFNHIANNLCFQYGKRVENQDSVED
jgi:hypothetical protein